MRQSEQIGTFVMRMASGYWQAPPERDTYRRLFFMDQKKAPLTRGFKSVGIA